MPTKNLAMPGRTRAPKRARWGARSTGETNLLQTLRSRIASQEIAPGAKLREHELADAFRAPFALGDPKRLLALCRDAGIVNATAKRHDGRVRFDSIASLVSTERACVWTLGGLLDNVQFDRLLEAAEESLRPFTAADGKVDFVMPALVIVATK